MNSKKYKMMCYALAFSMASLSLTGCQSNQDASGKTVTIQNTDGSVYVQGDSAYTITVTSYN